MPLSAAMELVPLSAALELIGAVLRLPLGSQSAVEKDLTSLRGQCQQAGFALYKDRKRQNASELQITLITHLLQPLKQAAMQDLEAPLPSPYPFPSAARRPHVSCPQPEAAALSPPSQTPVKTPSKKRRKSSSVRRRPSKKTPLATNPLLCDDPLTLHRAEQIADACAIVDVLQPTIDALPWENTFDDDGEVLQLGRKYHSLYVHAKYVAAGWSMGASSGVAQFVYDTGAHGLRNLWQNFISSEQSFTACMSKRGQHPKMQDLLESVQTQIDCRAWLEQHSDDKGEDRSCPTSFARWLNDTQLPLLIERETGKHRQIGVLVAQERKRKVTLPLHGRSSALEEGGADPRQPAAGRPAVPAAAAAAAHGGVAAADVLAAVEAQERVTVSVDTAARYMRRLGFTRRYWRKGTFFDGHDRADVVADRLLYLAEKLEQDKNTLHAMPSTADVELYMRLPLKDRPFIEIVHDESACNANDRLKFQYVHTSKSATLRSKSNGAGLMTSAFITEVLAGVLADAEGVAAETLEYGKGVWWNSARMLAQLRKVVAIRNRLFPFARCIWRFDHSSNHKAKSENALNVYRMSIGPGGKQAVMRSTIVLDACLLQGQEQSLVFESPHPRAGQAKGLKQVLDERWGPAVAAAYTGRARKKNLQLRLLQDQDFNVATTLIHDLLAELCPHDICRFYPKFHCEFSPIERFWSDHKRFCRTYCKGNITGLRIVVPQGLDAVCGDSIQRYFGLCRRYEAAYRLHAVSSKNVDAVVRAYTSHRKVSESTLQSALITSLGRQSSTLTGLCHCHSCVPVVSVCLLGCCATAKQSVCTAPRCAEHGIILGDDASVPSVLAAAERKTAVAVGEDDVAEEPDAEPDTFIVCRLKTCRRWRRVPLAWYNVFKRGAEQFSCQAVEKECESKCCRCNNKTCKCRCEECGKGKSCVCVCPGCAQRVNECSCSDADDLNDGSGDDARALDDSKSLEEDASTADDSVTSVAEDETMADPSEDPDTQKSALLRPVAGEAAPFDMFARMRSLQKHMYNGSLHLGRKPT